MGHTDVKRCKNCRAEERQPDGRGAPPGWLSLSVTTPPGVTTRNGQPFIWVGLYCCVACLLSDGPQLEQAEALAGWVERRAAGQHLGR